MTYYRQRPHMLLSRVLLISYATGEPTAVACLVGKPLAHQAGAAGPHVVTGRMSDGRPLSTS